MKHLQQCLLCPRQCGVNRLSGAKGYCGAGAKIRIFRWGAHHGEEPPISGTHGSGTVFFSHCSLRCLYCQNYPWTSEGAGEDYSVEGLVEILRALSLQHCHNWNLVTPEPWLPFIREAALQLDSQGIKLPFVYNTSGYVRREIAEEFKLLQDVVLTDLRYASRGCATEGSKAPDYPDVARSYLRWCRDNIGPLELDSDGIATRGLIVRILVLPGREQEAIDSLRWLHRELGTGVHVSLMSQYTPVHKALETPTWNRTITEEEFERVTDVAFSLGMETGWTQELEASSAEEFLLGSNMPPGEGSVAPTLPQGSIGTPRSS